MTSPINQMVDNACGVTADDMKRAAEKWEQQKQAMDALLGAVEDWYASPTRPSTEALRSAWREMVAIDHEAKL